MIDDVDGGGGSDDDVATTVASYLLLREYGSHMVLYGFVVNINVFERHFLIRFQCID